MIAVTRERVSTDQAELDELEMRIVIDRRRGEFGMD
jgi:hypothetical protein